jgi:ABC-type nitrate/sulfonate/bicarbonate transport system substrate-binding protein
MQAEEGLTATLVGRPGVNSLEQLRGQLLAGDPGDSNLDLIRMKILRSHGIRESDYKIDIIGSSPKRLEAFLAGRVAAAMLTPPSTEKALAACGVALARADDYVPGWTRRTWLEAHRDIIIRFIRAWAGATDWMMEEKNRGEAVRLTMAKEHMDRERAEEACARVVAKARINPRAIRSVMELRIEMGVMKPDVGPAEKFYDAGYWSEATGLPPPEPAGLPHTK